MTEVELDRMELGRNQYVVSLELGIFQGRPKSIRPNSETVKIRPMAQEADSTHFRSPQHRVYIAPRQVPVSQQKVYQELSVVSHTGTSMCGIKSCVCDVIWQVLEPGWLK